MKKYFIIIISIFIILCFGYLVKAENTKAKEFHTYEEIVSQNNHAVLYFYSETCTFCNEFYPVFKKLSTEFKDKYSFATVNVYNPRYTQVCDNLKIETLPSIFIYEPSRRVMHPVPPYYFEENRLRTILENFPVQQ